MNILLAISAKVTLITRNTFWVSDLPANSFNYSDFIFVGGFNPRFIYAFEYWGANQYEFPLNTVFYSKVGLQWELAPKFFLTWIANYANVEYPMKWVWSGLEPITMNGESQRFGYVASIGYNSQLGPFALSVARDIYSDSFLTNLSMGFWF